MKSLLIIGGTGFFGKSILDVFVRGGLDIYGIKRITIGARRVEGFKLSYPELINSHVHLCCMDITVCDTLPEADLVIHAASSSDARDYLADSLGHRQNIEVSTTNYCELAKKFHNNSKIVYCSSGAVYGQQDADVEFISEESHFQDVCEMVDYKREYALGKRASELAIQNLGFEGLNVSIARCFAFYGKYLPKEQHFAYGNFISAAEQGKTIEVYAKNRVFRSYMHADDMVHALMHVALDARPECPIYNVGSDEAIEIRDLAKKIAKEYNVGVNIADIQDDSIDRYVPEIKRLSKLKARNNLTIIENVNNS
jgi:nucleoside-diphosphate-sugar epimerase